MAKKKKSFYSSLKDLTKVPLRDLKPLKIEKKRHPIHMSLRKRILSTVIVCVILMIVTVTVGRSWGPLNTIFNAVASPVQKGFAAVGEWISSWQESAKSSDTLRRENKELQQRLASLEYENTLQEVQLSKLQELYDLYDLDQYYADYPKSGAQVIGVSASNWYDSITIDKGSADGIEKYMPVLSGKGLMGHVETVYQHYSRIVSILSDSSFVYGEVLRSGDHVGVQGDLSLEQDGVCKIEFYIQQTDIAVGDEIVTSALGDVYPPGIGIGTVTEITEKGDGVMGIAYLKPYADIKNISYVLIITDMEKKPDLTKEEDSMSQNANSAAGQDSGDSSAEAGQ